MLGVVLCGLVGLSLQWQLKIALDDQKEQKEAEKRTDQNFVQHAASAGLAEVELGKLALKRATNPHVKKFAERLVKDHSQANEELKRLATEKNILIPDRPSNKHRTAIRELSMLPAAEFDRAFLRHTVKAHKESFALFEGQVKRGQDLDLKAFAAKALPTIKDHLDMAKQIGGVSDEEPRKR